MNPIFHALSENALLVEFGHTINRDINDRVLSLFDILNEQRFTGFREAVPAYSSIAVYYDVVSVKRSIPHQSAADTVKKHLLSLLEHTGERNATHRLVDIPVCYDESFGLDLTSIASSKNLDRSEVIQLHTARSYHIYMMGFLPGFAYMGEVDDRISMPRKSQPRLTVPPGSVGIAGVQTGIYPLQSPGGWQIIGRTPLKLFDPSSDDPVLLKAGDTVRFYQITKDEFEDHQARNS